MDDLGKQWQKDGDYIKMLRLLIHSTSSTHRGSSCNNELMKSLASCETCSNDAVLKSKRASLIRSIVIWGLSPKNGDVPVSLREEKKKKTKTNT